MATCNVEQLMSDGKCFGCLGPKEIKAALAQLLCDTQAGVSNLEVSITQLAAAITAALATLSDALPTVEDLVYATPLTLDFDGADYQRVALTGVINFADSSNRPAIGSAKAIAVIIEADGSDRALSFNANWTFVGTEPTQIAANKTGVLSLTALGPDETDVICAYQEEE